MKRFAEFKKRLEATHVLRSQLECRDSSIFRVQHSPPHKKGRSIIFTCRTRNSSDLSCNTARKVGHCFQSSPSFLLIFSAKDQVKHALMNLVGGFSYHISNPKSFDKRFLSQNPSIGVNNVLLSFVWWSLTPLQMQVTPGSSVRRNIFRGFFFFSLLAFCFFFFFFQVILLLSMVKL